MGMIHAVYENGVFKPTGPVALPEPCEVEFEPRVVSEPVPQATPHTFIRDPNPDLDEFNRILDAMASRPAGKVLPPDFSRADIYDDHD